MENSKKILHRYKLLLSAVGRRHIGGVSKCTPSFFMHRQICPSGGLLAPLPQVVPLDAFYE